MKPGESIGFADLENGTTFPLVVATKAEDGYVLVTSVNGDKAMTVALTAEQADALAAALRKAAR